MNNSDIILLLYTFIIIIIITYIILKNKELIISLTGIDIDVNLSKINNYMSDIIS